MYAPTPRTTASRLRDRVGYQRATAHAILDEAHHCALGFTVDGEPRVLPTLHVRVGDTLYLHGSTGSRPLLAARGPAGLPVCVCVTLLDGLVYARSHLHHSANYRSVVAHGVARLVTDSDERRVAMDALVDKVGHGRSTDSRPPSRKELAETAVLALPLTEVSVKVRAGGVADDPADLDLPHWAGVIPLRLVPGPPEPAPGVVAPLPDYLRPAHSPWLATPTLHGEHVRLEPLEPGHARELTTALADPQVWRYATSPQPTSPEQMAGHVAGLLRARWLGERLTWVQRDTRTGEVAGLTAFVRPDEATRSVEIGATLLGQGWWRTGINTEAKLLLLGHAFDTLGAVRVSWQTDIRNERSQRAIARLGAVREGVLRANKRRADGTWRDSVLYSMTAEQWPEAQLNLRKRLLPPAPVGRG
ncbi:bifunctional pyridoxamine 5'-phosphate oxidase family protein/GNAT family N-acetyltransferase [Solwaraspora sp. WMMD1047]|uniref:bifunctional pyridoxamine 5'-phosphate oxidase family protein/GNAT family N-acetyltransferase n=1 Tax=Solwaraspora sp. WMMD1047 TaxID=3016102 RepID=UPI002416CCB4|nr:bifunctional pyridoxamine 5'-phosphate oxidase family protein/GNAT family N-acetyltransferase [Solwaraspora sp. WMMD1047]MDG4829719.1 bifunctional pyridoxamine 5'-phosphate oxidase family protein/GNAT family N-acetyltransferase [Solwaraspora sp. WMMD1047]